MNPGNKITAAHLAGIRPITESKEDSGDASSSFVAGFAIAMITLPELRKIFELGPIPGAPHPTLDLLFLVAFIAFFGIFPIALLHHGFLERLYQKKKSGPTRMTRLFCSLLTLALMAGATTAMRPLVGFDQKLAENRAFGNRARIETNRSPASIKAVRE